MLLHDILCFFRVIVELNYHTPNPDLFGVLDSKYGIQILSSFVSFGSIIIIIFGFLVHNI